VTAEHARPGVPFFRPDLGEAETREVLEVLKSGWLTTGPRVHRFEVEFAAAVRARHAVALNSATAALHLATEALKLEAGDGVLVPTLTFAATAEVVRYHNAHPILVDCDPDTLNLDLADADRKIAQARRGELPNVPAGTRVVGVIPVHVGGLMLDIHAVEAFAAQHGLWIVEDAAHAFPASWRESATSPWRRCGEHTAAVSCFSFYANKTITTGEGGMAVTDDEHLAERIRLMSLHGLSRDAWTRYSGGASWDYRIVAPGFKYNLTDLAAAIGVHQLPRAEAMRARREAIAHAYQRALKHVDAIDLPADPPDRIHSWHLFPIRLRLDQLTVTRAAFIEALRHAGIGCSVHWRPLHLHPYYEIECGWKPAHCPVASREWERLVSLPLFPSMTSDEHARVVAVVRDLCARFAR
jgi:perosamine synthetase